MSQFPFLFLGRPLLLRRPLSALVVLALAVPAVLAGCRGNDSTTVRPPSTSVPGEDRSENGEISVDVSKLAARIEGDTLLLTEIPLSSLKTGKGSVEVALASVDGTRTYANETLAYDLSKGQSRILEARLRLPRAVASQAQLVEYNLVIVGDDDLRVTRSVLHVVPAHEVQLQGPKRLSADKQVSYRVVTRNALSGDPIVDQAVRFSLVAPDGTAEEHSVTTDAVGSASIQVQAPVAGEYSVRAETQAFGVAASLDESVEVEALASRVLLTTDKPIYKPGQSIHLRALALARADRSPQQATSVVFEVEDGKGNKILKKEVNGDEYGIASTEFRLGTILNEGTFKVRAVVGEAITEKTVTVEQYALPKYRVGIETNQPWYLPGQTVELQLDANYFFGKPVANAALTVELGGRIVAEEVFDRVQTRTNAEGKIQVSLQLPSALPGLDINAGNALAFVRITALDGAGQQVVVERSLTVSQDPLQLSLVPELGKLVSGLENRLQLFVTDPLSTPAPMAEVEINFGGETSQTLTTDAFGHALVRWTPSAAASNVTVNVVTGGNSVTEDFSFGQQEGEQPLIVRTDRSVYEVGDEVEIEILTTDSSIVYLDWLNDGQAVEQRSMRAENGVARLSIPIDTGLLGDNRIEAYVVADDGNLIRAGRSVFANSGQSLQISVEGDQEEYTPGTTAELTFQVQDEQGQPVVAALGVQIVDEAVFAVVDSQPGLLRTHFELEDEFAQPSYQLRAPGGDLGTLLLGGTGEGNAANQSAAQDRVEAKLAALGDAPLTGLYSGSWQEVVTASRALIAPLQDLAKQRLLPELTRVTQSAIKVLSDRGCSTEQYYCEAVNSDYVSELRREIASNFSALDFWGTVYESQAPNWDEALKFVSSGPDELPGTGDELEVSVLFVDIELQAIQFGAPETGVDLEEADNGAFPAAGEGTNSGGSGGGDSDDSGPRVRQDFPETLYVNPALITDGSGSATVTVDLADSITEWRVSSLAHTADGRLGGAINGIRVFQDFFVDIDFPATLTRGDEVEFPIAVYNYLDTAQTVNLDLEAAGWYTPLGATALSLDLLPGEVRGVSLPIRVEEVGLQSLTLTGVGEDAADAVARTVRVLPDGQILETAQSSALAAGTQTHEVEFPANAIEGSEQLFMNVYPAFLSQAVSGMDSVLQVPSGCFEQTTSTTWPNVLVTQYMEETGQITPEIQLKAESFISAGYQRLLTFEHPGGGFSWFGTQDAAPFLSVTAFGLMEFADMKAVHAVDEAMLARTQSWLVAQQEADGSWQGDQSEFFSFHTSGVRNTAFVLWALAENGYNGSALQQGLAYVKANLSGGNASEQDDPYTLALIANAMVLVGDSDAPSVLQQLDDLKQQEGDQFYWSTDLQTNFYGGGRDADVSATALVLHALLREGGYAETIDGGLDFLSAAKDSNGNFGSTQATTWSLKTLLLAATKGTEGSEGTLTVSVDGTEFAQVPLQADASELMTTVDMTGLATTGSHEVTVDFVGTGKVSYNLVSRHNVPWAEAPTPALGPLSIALSYTAEQLQVDDTVTATVAITNNTERTTNMALVTLGIPPGFAVELADFDSYLEEGVLSRAEVTGKQLILYVSELAAEATQSFDYRLRATMPVRASDGGAEIALYYEPEQKSQAPATTLVAVAR